MPSSYGLMFESAMGKFTPKVCFLLPIWSFENAVLQRYDDDDAKGTITI